MIIREMSSTLGFEHIESVAKQSGCDWLVLEYVRGILVPQSRNIEAVKLLNRWQEKIESSFTGRDPISVYEVFLWALTALEFGETDLIPDRSTSELYLPSVERIFEQICDDRVAGLSVASSGLLEFDTGINMGASRTEFEIQCVWISSLFLLGKKRPKWSFLQQLASSSFFQKFFLTGLAASGSSKDAYEFDAEHIFSLGHYSCVLLPFETAKRVLDSFYDHLINAGEVGSHELLAFAEAQKRILGKTASDVAEMVEELKSEKADVEQTKQLPLAQTRWAIELERQLQIKDGPLRIAKLQRARQRMMPTIEPEKSVAETIKKAIESTIGNVARGLHVLIEGDIVTVEATVPSFYIRQLVEHKSRSIVVDQLRKKFVSSVVVQT